jgi:hypothetical protein
VNIVVVLYSLTFSVCVCVCVCVSVLTFPEHPVEILHIEFHKNLLNGLWFARERLCVAIFKLGLVMD